MGKRSTRIDSATVEMSTYRLLSRFPLVVLRVGRDGCPVAERLMRSDGVVNGTEAMDLDRERGATPRREQEA